VADVAIAVPSGADRAAIAVSLVLTAPRHQYAAEPQAKLVEPTTLPRTPMQPPPPLDPDVADTAPSPPVLTGYD